MTSKPETSHKENSGVKYGKDLCNYESREGDKQLSSYFVIIKKSLEVSNTAYGSFRKQKELFFSVQQAVKLPNNWLYTISCKFTWV